MSGTQKKGLSAIMADTGSRRMLLFAGVAVAALGAYGFFHHSSVKVTPSSLGTIPTLPNGGVGPVSQNYAAALRRGDQERFEAASKTGGDALPSVIETQKATQLTPLNDDDAAAKPADPIIRPALPSEPVVGDANPHPVAALPSFNPQPEQHVVVAPPQLNPDEVGRLQAQLAKVLAHDGNFAPRVEYQQEADTSMANGRTGYGTSYNSTSFGGSGGGAGSNVSGNAGGGAGDVTQTSARPADTSTVASDVSDGPQLKMPAPGTVLYAKMVGEVNSDSPGPVIAEILQGPLTGSRIMGSFTTNVDSVVISFTTLTLPYTDDNGDTQTEVINIKAIAVDQSKLGTAMATSVDRHLLTKVGIALGTGFLQGFGQAVSQSGSTAVLGGTGSDYISNTVKSTPQELFMAGGTAAGQVGSTLQQEFGNQKTTIKVAADTPFGLLFLPTSSN